jgi:RNA polymerase nonessential primary-like sigma factor
MTTAEISALTDTKVESQHLLAKKESIKSTISKKTKPKRAASIEPRKPSEVQKTLDATQIYLNEIGFSPLLSAEEEVYFARKSLKG